LERSEFPYDRLGRPQAIHCRADDAPRVASPFTNGIESFDSRRLSAPALSQYAHRRRPTGLGTHDRRLGNESAMPAAIHDRQTTMKRFQHQGRSNLRDQGGHGPATVAARRLAVGWAPRQKIWGTLQGAEILAAAKFVGPPLIPLLQPD